MRAEDKTRILNLIGRVYDNHSAGGNAHIVLDDCNIENENIQWCLELPDITDAERECLTELLALTYEERGKTIDEYWSTFRGY